MLLLFSFLTHYCVLNLVYMKFKLHLVVKSTIIKEKDLIDKLLPVEDVGSSPLKHIVRPI